MQNGRAGAPADRRTFFPWGRQTNGHRRWSAPALPLLCVWAVVALGNLAPRADAQPQPGADDDSNTPFNLAPRQLKRHFDEAQKYIPEKRFSEAARALGRILDYHETPEDFFFQPNANEPVVYSLKTEARRLIGKMPAEGRDAYELEYGARARRILDKAVESGGTAGLAAVSRQFFHTKAGYEATYLLGAAEMEAGHSLAAALCFSRLTETSAADDFGPNLFLRLAVCWARAGMSQPALEALDTLRKNFPD